MPERPPFISRDMLSEIRRQTDWRRLFVALGLRRAPGGNARDWWAHSPFSEDRHASFHIGDQGWYCFSTGQGGGVIELVQAVMETRGQPMTCYQAGTWLVEQGLSPRPCGWEAGAGDAPAAAAAARVRTAVRAAVTTVLPAPAAAEPEAERAPNRPIRQDLRPRLDGGHAALAARGVSAETARLLGCGYLPDDSRSPLAGRLVFQVRGLQRTEDGSGWRPVILSHIGRAMTEAQAAADGKWRFYQGFHKAQEIYHQDRLLLAPAARAQIEATGRIVLVEGCFDVARLVEAGIHNVGATFGAQLSPEQLKRLADLAWETGTRRLLVWYDRDAAGQRGQQAAVALIEATVELTAEGFAWEAAFLAPTRGAVRIPAAVTDPAACTLQQLKWLRAQGRI